MLYDKDWPQLDIKSGNLKIINNNLHIDVEESNIVGAKITTLNATMKDVAKEASDMILTDECEPYVLEVNTLPGFTNHSLLPMSAKRAGIPMEKLCVKIMETALKNYRHGV